MLDNIVLTTDFSHLARSAYGAAAELAKEYGSTIHLVYEAERPPPLYYEHVSVEFPISDYFKKLEESLNEERKHPSLEGFDVKTHLLSDDHPYHNVLDFAENERMDMILISTQGRTGIAHALLGSFTEKIVRRSPVPVLTYRGKKASSKPSAPRSVLVPFDFSDNARAVVPTIRFLHEQHGTEFTLQNVVPEPKEYGHAGFTLGISHAEAEQELKRLKVKATEDLGDFCRDELSGVATKIAVSVGHAYREIVKKAEEMDADLILMATHGWTGLKHFFLGSVAEKVVRGAPCSVMTVRPQDVRTGRAKTEAESAMS